MWQRITGRWQRCRGGGLQGQVGGGLQGQVGGGLQGQVGGCCQGGEHAEYDAHLDQQEAIGGRHCYCSRAE